MKEYQIALLEGDGIGPEIIHEGRKVLEAAARALESQEFSGYFLRKHSDAAEIRKGALAAGRERMKFATVVRLSVI